MLHTYLSAHRRWRRAQAAAPPLQPAEKWVTLQHEEQVLRFLTRLTLSVHGQLLRARMGLPSDAPAAAGGGRWAANGPAFGSSSSRMGLLAAAGEQPSAAAAAAAAGLCASGKGVDLAMAVHHVAAAARRQPPTQATPRSLRPRQRLQQRQQQTAQHEQLQGWCVAEDSFAGAAVVQRQLAPPQQPEQVCGRSLCGQTALAVVAAPSQGGASVHASAQHAPAVEPMDAVGREQLAPGLAHGAAERPTSTSSSCGASSESSWAC
jgi:hypothetical protein